MPNDVTTNPAVRPITAWPSSCTKIETYVTGSKSAKTISGTTPSVVIALA
jgi:hypothetical protein